MRLRQFFAPLDSGSPEDRRRALFVRVFFGVLLVAVPLAVWEVLRWVHNGPELYPHMHATNVALSAGLVLVCLTGLSVQARLRWTTLILLAATYGVLAVYFALLAVRMGLL